MPRFLGKIWSDFALNRDPKGGESPHHSTQPPVPATSACSLGTRHCPDPQKIGAEKLAKMQPLALSSVQRPFYEYHIVFSRS